MPRYTDESREKVRDATDFAELVGARTELKRAGANRLQGLCPFHDERTPSFGIDPVEKLYHCFGCGAGGDVFSFVMETEGLDFAGALESLADRAGVELEREAEDPREAALRQRDERLLRAARAHRGLLRARAVGERRGGRARGTTCSAAGSTRACCASSASAIRPSAGTACWWPRARPASRRRSCSRPASRYAVARAAAGSTTASAARIMFPLADEKGRVRGFGARGRCATASSPST